jgi:hypothetical protein
MHLFLIKQIPVEVVQLIVIYVAARLCEAERNAMALRLEEVGAELTEAQEGCDRMRQESAMVSKVAAHNDELKQRNAQLVVENASVKTFIKERDELQIQAQRAKVQIEESERLR